MIFISIFYTEVETREIIIKEYSLELCYIKCFVRLLSGVDKHIRDKKSVHF